MNYTMDRTKRSSSEIFHNARIKVFPRVGIIKQAFSAKPCFKEPGWEALDMRNPRENYERGAMGENASEASIRRAKMRVFEYAMLNEFEYFITWTLDKEKIDRYDKKLVAEKMQTFLSDKVKRNDLRYIIVPELHKDGAIHAHGFVSGNLKMVNSGKRDRAGRTIYNVTDWKYGFSTAVRISGDYQKACYYITKYIEKCDKMIFGNFYYAGGNGLIREPETVLYDDDFSSIDAKEHAIATAEGEYINSFKYKDGYAQPDMGMPGKSV